MAIDESSASPIPAPIPARYVFERDVRIEVRTLDQSVGIVADEGDFSLILTQEATLDLCLRAIGMVARLRRTELGGAS